MPESSGSQEAKKKSVCEILKFERGRKRLSLSAIHQETRITVHYLESLEAGDWKAFPAEVYLVGFMRKYAQYLGLNPDQIEQSYREETCLPREEPKTPEPVPQEKNEIDNKTKIFLKYVGLAVLVVAIAIWHLYTSILPSVKKRAHKKMEPVAMATVPEPTVPLKLRLLSGHSVWIRIYADGEMKYEGFVSPQAQPTFEAQQKIQVRVGNVKAVRAWLNEVPIDLSLGEKAGVNEVTLTEDSWKRYEIVSSAKTIAVGAVTPHETVSEPSGSQEKIITPPSSEN